MHFPYDTMMILYVLGGIAIVALAVYVRYARGMQIVSTPLPYTAPDTTPRPTDHDTFSSPR